jgi:hypothetical protein
MTERQFFAGYYLPKKRDKTKMALCQALYLGWGDFRPESMSVCVAISEHPTWNLFRTVPFPKIRGKYGTKGLPVKNLIEIWEIVTECWHFLFTNLFPQRPHVPRVG